MKNKTNYKYTGIISNIFKEHWNSYYSKYKSTIDDIITNAFKEVTKIINCSNHNLDASFFSLMKIKFFLPSYL